jgi:hypothetical protein
MDTIEQFRELCTDGRSVAERSSSVTERWKSSTVVRLQWKCGERRIEIEHVYGIAAQVLPDRRSVAVLRVPPQGRFATALEFLDPYGQRRFVLESPLIIDGQRVTGEFAWFETTADGALPVVRVVFWTLTGDRYFLLDVSATDGRITAFLPLQ